MATSDSLDKLISRRSNYKGRLTRIYNFVDNEDNHTKIYEIKVRQAELADLFNKYNVTQEDIEMLEEQTSKKPLYDIDRSTIEDKYYQYQAKIAEILKDHDHNQTTNSFQSLQRQESKEPNLKLPYLQIPTFEGNISEWSNFKALFDGVIDTNNQLNSLQKLQYLKSLLRGEAASLIGSLSVTASNYKPALDILKRRYENKLLSVNFHIKNIMSFQNINRSNLKDFLVTLQQSTDSLKALSVPVDTWDIILIYLIVQNLDQSLRSAWELNRKSDDLPTLKELTEFLTHRARAFELMYDKSQPVTKPNNNVTKYKPTRVSTHVSTATSSCTLCKMSHELYKCPTFLEMPITKRNELVKSERLCYNCLKPYNHQHVCSKNVCSHCGRKHHSTLHRTFNNYMTSVPETSNANSNTTEKVSSSVVFSDNHTYDNVNSGTQASVMHLQSKQCEVYLSTALIKIQQYDGNWITCRALLDSGSQVCLITSNLAQKLQLSLSEQTNYSIQGIGAQPIQSSKSVKANIASRNSNFETTITCVVTEHISTKLPQNYIPISNFKLPKHCKLADPLFYVPKHIDILLGGQLFYTLLQQGSIQLGKNQPTLINTVFGWVVTGDIELKIQANFNDTVHYSQNKQLTNQTVISAHASCETSCDKLLQRFWEQEEVKSSPINTPEHIYCEELYKSTTTRDETSGRFTVHLPIIQDKIDQLGQSYSIAQKCFMTLERKLHNNPQLHKQYKQFIDEYIQLGHASYIPNPNLSTVDIQDKSKQFFLPHHAVIKPQSVSTKLRVVFNGSSQSSTSVSLNQVLYEGPNIYTDIIDIIIRLRTYKFVLSCDIVKMFRNIRVTEDHCNLQCILWRNSPDDKLQAIRLNTVTYGTRCAPYLAFRTLLELAKQDGHLYPLAAHCIQHQTFMDDVHCGCNSLPEAIETCNQLIMLFKKGGFQLHKWTANNPMILQSVIQNQDKFSPKSLIIGDETSTLGLKWDPVTDVFKVSIPNLQQKEFSKRSVLSIIAQIYDPIGYFSPVSVKLKIFMQCLWKETTLNWDTPLPSHLLSEWLPLYNSLQILREITIPRYCFSDIPSRIHLVGYSDASLVAYGCCIYLVAEYSNKQPTSNLVISKTRVAPLKTVSIPRLELCASVLLSKLMQKIKPALEVAIKIQSVHFYTDSTIVLNWLRSPYKKWEVYVANRISQILQSTDSTSWNHTRSHDNAADVLTHGIHPKDLQNLYLWWHGPPYLLLSQNEWPHTHTQTLTHTDNISEIQDTTEFQVEPYISTETSLHTACLVSEFYNYEDINYFINIFQRFSSFHRLQNTIAQCYRFVNNLKHKCSTSGPLTLEELKCSHNFIIKIVQASQYKKELIELKSNKGNYTYTSSPIKKLSPFIDSDGILRVGGRIKHANVQYNQKFPIILPNKNHITTLIINKFHIDLFHSGVQNTVANLRLVYWPIHARVEVKKVVYKCIVCTRYRAQTCKQKMSNLPYHRVNLERPFLHSGVDFAGPIYIKSSNLRNAKYIRSFICIFSCLSTRNTHIELSEDTTTQSFLACLKRFSARRGICNTLYSDNASYFHCANNELHDLYKMFKNETSYSQIIEYTNRFSINWVFTTPLASHMGGVYEIVVKQTKQLLKKKLGNCRMTYCQLYTILCELESILNSRPLFLASDSSQDLNFLCPSHFTIGTTLLDIPEPSLIQISDNKLNLWQRISSIKQQFWKEFYKSYLSEIQSRQKWFKESRNLQIGDLVIIKDENTPPSTWPVGRIINVHISKDDHLTRSVTVKTSKGQYQRPIHKLVLLPIE